MKQIFAIVYFALLMITCILIFNTTIYAQESLSTSKKNINNESVKKPFNIAVASDWGCDENAQTTAKNIQSKDPELVIAGGDASYKESASCWFK